MFTVAHISLCPYTTRCSVSAGSSPLTIKLIIRVGRSPAAQEYLGPYPWRCNQNQISSNTSCAAPDQVPHPSLTVSTSIIKSKVNSPNPGIYNPLTRLEEGRRRRPPINCHKQGSDNCEKNCVSDMMPVLQSPVDHGKLRHGGQ